jgi:hypothetical protein
MENAGNGALMTGDIFIFAFVQLYSYVEVRIYWEFTTLSEAGVENSFIATLRIRPTPVFTITDEEWRQRVEEKETNAKTCLEKVRSAVARARKAQESNASKVQRAAAKLRAQVPEEHRQYHHAHVVHVRYSKTHDKEDGHYDHLEPTHAPQTHQQGAHSSGAGATQATQDANSGSDDRGSQPSDDEEDQPAEQPSQAPGTDYSSPSPMSSQTGGATGAGGGSLMGRRVLAGWGGLRHSQGPKGPSKASAGSLALWDGHRGHARSERTDAGRFEVTFDDDDNVPFATHPQPAQR